MRHLRILIASGTLIASSLFIFQNATETSELNPVADCNADSLCPKVFSAMMLGRTDSSGKVNNELELIDLAAERLGYGLSSSEPYLQPQDELTKDKTIAKLYQVALIIARQLKHSDANVYNPAVEDLIAHIAPSMSLTQLQIVQNNAILQKKTQELNEQIQTLCTAAPYKGNLSQCSQSVAFKELNFYYTNARRATVAHRKEISAQEPKIQLLRKIAGSQTFSDQSVRDSQVNIQEVLAEFWFNHFNVDRKKTELAGSGKDGYDFVIRERLFGKFSDLLFAVETSPAMLVYLDNQGNEIVDGKPSNQNLGRELLELHSFGVGTDQAGYNGKIIYNQADVELASKILAGVGIQTQRNENGVPTVYRGAYFPFKGLAKIAGDDTMIFGKGRVYESSYFVDSNGNQYGKLKKLTEDLSDHPQVQNFVCGKLISHMMAQTPTVKKSCLDTWKATNGNLRAIYQAIITSPEFWSPANYRTRIKNPLELVASSLRLHGTNLKDIVDLSLQQIVQVNERYWDETAKDIKSRVVSKTVYFGDEVLVTAENEVNRLGLSYRNVPPPTGYEANGFNWRGAGYLARITDASVNIASVYEVFNKTYRAPLHIDAIEATFHAKLETNPTEAYLYVFQNLLKQDWNNINSPTFYQRQYMLNAAKDPQLVDLRGPASPIQPIPLKTVLTLATANRWFLFK